MSQREIGLIGMQRSGKTTWLGRLWHAVRQPDGRLQLDGLPEKLHGLRLFADPLVRNEYPLRSNAGASALDLPLRWVGTSTTERFMLSVSDYDGEEIDRIFEKRDIAWKQHWERRAAAQDGLLIMVRPAVVRPVSAGRLVAGMSAPARDVDAPESVYGFLQDPRALAADVRGVKAPSAVALVELLQFLRHARGWLPGDRPDPVCFRVAVAVSCWDALSRQERTSGPEAWFHKELPLLSDYIETNFHPRGIRVFGLSSTGGDLKDKEFRGRIEDEDLDISELGETVWVAPQGGDPRRSCDVTLPLGWILEGDGALG